MPIGADVDLTAEHRRAPDEPVISAVLIAAVQDHQIIGWKKPSFAVQQVNPDSSLEALDLSICARVLGADNADADANNAGAIGINRMLAQKIIEEDAQQVPLVLQRSAFDRASLQILDRLHGHPSVGVRIA